MNNYKSYSDAQSFWIDKAPSHWKRLRNKHIFKQKKEIVGESWEAFTLLTMGKGGVKPRDMDGGGKFPESFESYQVVKPEQLIFCLFDLDETPRTVGLSKDHGMITSAYDVFSTTEGNDPQYWTYFYQTIDDHKGLRPYYTGLRKVVRYDTFMGIDVYSPPHEEQKLISRYLDKKTSQIDSLINKIEKKIELLKEQRTTLIDQCVTKGLDPNVEMKDSGVEWIGQIPKHWECKKLKLVSKLISEKRLPVEGDIKISPENVESESGKILNFYSEYDTEGQIFTNGDILFNKLRVYLNKVVLCDFSGLSMGEMIVIRPQRIAGAFLHRVLNSVGFIEHVNSLSNGVKLPRPPVDGIFNCSIPVPPESEQYEISKYVGTGLKKIESLIERHMNRITLVLEYRQSLISSVVTGKLRVMEEMV